MGRSSSVRRREVDIGGYAPIIAIGQSSPPADDFKSKLKSGKITGTDTGGIGNVTVPAVSLAKTTRPSLESTVLRERLFSRLDMGIEGPVTWIQGPPGSGKTTLVSSFLDARGLRYVWYQIDPDDNDVATFFYYLRLALVNDATGDKAAEHLTKFTPQHLQHIGQFARQFFREMYHGLGKPFVFVLDNYQDIQPRSGLHEALDAGIRELPDWGAIVVMSRSDPTPQMARLRASRQMELLTWEDLRLTKEETEKLVNLQGHEQTGDAIETLHALTEGWAAGLVLLMEIPHRERLRADAIGTMTMDVIFDYFGEEAFNAFPAVTQEFLLKAAFLPKTTGPMAEELTGLKDAAVLLKDLARKNYFVSERFGGSEHEFQFHRLFREFLMRLAESRYSREYFHELQSKVAQILQRNGQIESAVEIFLELSDWGRVADIIELNAASMLAYGRSETLAYWLDGLPGPSLNQHPWMLYWSAAASFHTSPRESRQHYEQAYRAFEAGAGMDIKGMVLSCCGATDTILIEADDLTSLDPWIARSEALLKQHPTYFRGKEFARVSGTMLMAVAIRQPQHPMLDTWIGQVTHIAKTGEDTHTRLIVAPLSALALLLTGRLNDARELIRILREYREVHPVRPQISVMINVMDAMDRVLSGNTTDCLNVVDSGLEDALQHGHRAWFNLLLAFGAGTALIDRKPKRAWDYLDKLAPLLSQGNRLEKCLFHYFHAWASLISNDKITAYQSIKTALSLAIEVGMPLLETLCRSGLARVAFDCDDRRTATAQLRKVHGLVKHINNPLVEFQTLMTFADLALGDGRVNAGMNALRYGLSLGREHGFEHVMGWEPRTVANLCVRALEQDIEADYVRRLISNSQLTPSRPPYNTPGWPWRYRMYSLSSFSFLVESKAVSNSSRSKGRPLDLLKVLLANGGTSVKAERLAETLWPHVDKDYAQKSFTINLHRLRKLFGADDALLLQDGLVALNRNIVWFDVWSLEQTCQDIDETLGKPISTLENDQLEVLANRIFELYRGPFFGDDVEFPCFATYRDQIATQMARCLRKIASQFEHIGAWQQAAEYYERGITVSPIEESFYRHLIICHQHLGRTGEALNTYERCRNSLWSSGELSPSLETQALFANLSNGT